MASSVLSIVVPIYNVAPYLDECLESIAIQTRGELEVILVNDGSKDDSGDIAERFAAKDSRFKVVHKENAGLGAARNTGLEHVTGDYLMFMDSDDALPAYTAELLVGILEKTGSDFSCGNVMRLSSKGLIQSGMHRDIFQNTKLRTHVDQQPALLGDRTAWNKVYRKTFWDAQGLRFPEGVLYEDTPVTVPLHVLAKSVDVIDVPIYYWREREGDDKSITQRREELKAFTDRLENCWQVSRLLGESGHHATKRLYDETVLTGDLNLFVKVLPIVDDEYRRVFMERTNDYLDTIDPEAILELPANQRVLWTLIRNRMLREVLELVPVMRKQRRIARKGLRRYHDMDLYHEKLPQLPPELFAAGTPRPRTKVHDVSWRDGKLHIRGHAFIPGQSSPRPWSTSRLIWLKEGSGRRTKRTPLITRRCIDATADHGSPQNTYDWSGFDAVIDPQSLRTPEGTWKNGTWTVVTGVVGLGRMSKGSLEMGQPANPVKLTGLDVGDDVRITPFVKQGRLRVRVERVPARLTGGRLNGDHLEVEGRLHSDALVTSVTLSRIDGLTWRRYPVELDGEKFRFRIPVGDVQREGLTYQPLRIAEPTDRFRIELAVGTKRSGVVACGIADDFRWDPIDLGALSVHVHAALSGEAQLVAMPTGPVLTGVSTADRKFRFTGRVPGQVGQFKLVLRPFNARETWSFPAEVAADGTWSVEVDPIAVPNFDAHVRIRTGMWNVLYRDGNGPVQPLPAVAEAMASLPLPLAGDSPRVSLEWLTDERVVLRVRSALTDEERGRANQSRLREKEYPSLREQPLRDVVLYNSFTGRQYSDSPRAVHEELVARGAKLEHQWVTTDGQAPLPHTADPVALWSRRWYESLATSRYIVTNQHLPEWFKRRPGQIVVQTWHGTPLKRIGFDIADVQFTDRRYLEKLELEAPNWSFLVSPNTFSTPILRRAFKYDGELMEIGYPRNDLLFKDRAEIKERVRKAAGIPEGKKLVVYAPTWRDDEYSGGSYQISMKIDILDAAEKLGDDHALLVRRHPNVVDEIPGNGDGFVYDMSTYPDMADLLAAADILITDYSSVMFDFANTGRPMLFFTYDLAHYRDELRGFYFDFEQEAPGPLLSTSEEVVAAIRDIDAIAARYTDRYRAFAAKGCDLDDGAATGRLIDGMLAAGKQGKTR
ncbi:bifunctional glycosyltransferase/CDP-glycerol:glycerophosphate glycerophosphotransferase [Actinoplanes friuliensis]|uniref:Putative CDP-glycerol--polyglycerol phosphate glycero-phosphotransferase n=1 Tax=Actinoplanes friuliensis DSM 7358 TaxID=1246995 RepID=U5WE04_9ACTN|nr:bifunctional glycosyltransferase family 2 protein/CDP-glycerol:glycerophosphate glycerophosphotransferase [Actinoplanes friuliensis]AGZ46151.1 putative CDP-glycerol--polyglycerol phosphate glycero-phosphotransferase [Actinoplanes friuliensis DSM 7358]